nr:D-glycerate dehydrogenase [uncultured Lichenicoccus sp.]
MSSDDTITDRPRLVVTQALPPAVEARIAAEFDAVPLPALPPGGALDADMLVDLARSHGAEAIVLSGHLRIDAALLDRLPESLRMIACVAVGTDHVDLAAVRARGLVLTNTPDVLTETNADMTWLLILAAARRATEYAAIMRAGWDGPLAIGQYGTDVHGKTLGIIGMGRIGRAVARRARGFDMRVLYSNRRRLAPELEEGAEYVPDLRELLPHAQILTVHAPGGSETDGLIDAAMLSLLPQGAVFINASRGSVVDEDALIAALETGHLAGAGLDVFRNEPHPDPRLLALPNLFATPHAGSATMETRTAMGMRALDNVRAEFSDSQPQDLIIAGERSRRCA